MNNITVIIDDTLKTDFFNEINNTNDSEDEGNDEDENNRCLISYDILNENSIKLPCEHSFNYFPLYQEICNQKLNINFREIVRLKIYQIKCPYCRTVHDNLIPYHEMDGVISKHGVTKPNKYVLMPDNCKYIFKSGKNKGKKCNKNCNGEYCSKVHKKFAETKVKLQKYINHDKNESKEPCNIILKSGKRTGKECGRIQCKYHKNVTN